MCLMLIVQKTTFSGFHYEYSLRQEKLKGATISPRALKTVG
jgi:hypothetical protein